MNRTVITAGFLVAGLTCFSSWPTGRSFRTVAALNENPELVNTCLISSDIHTMSAFYQQILKIVPQFESETYIEFRTGKGILSIFDARAQETYIPGSAQSSANRTAIIEFKVADVDGEYARLQKIVKAWVKPPTTQPWGTRSIYFRDPDGNLLNFFAPTKTQQDSPLR